MKSMMQYRGYRAGIEYDGDDEIFVGKVIGISDSLNFHGASIEELRRMFEQSIDRYLETCEKLGRQPDKEFKGSFNIRISPALHRELAFEAAENKMTLNQFVTRALENAVHAAM